MFGGKRKQVVLFAFDGDKGKQETISKLRVKRSKKAIRKFDWAAVSLGYEGDKV